MTTLLLKQAQILEADQLVTRDVLVTDDTITAVAPQLDVTADRVIQATGQLLTPGLVDIHVHFREPGFEYKETIATGSRAAARGGFTTVAAMPNLNPVPATLSAFETVQARNQASGVVHIAQYGAISEGLTADEIGDLPALAATGAIAFTNDGKGVQTAATMLDAMVAAAKVNRPLVAHVEDESLVKGGVMNLGARSTELGLPGINPLAESAQLARDLMLAQATGVHYHVAHLSTKESVTLVRLAKQNGIHVTAEVSPHHLLLDETDITGDDALFKMNPPLRAPVDRAAVIAGLLDGTIDMVATDHAPHGVAEKERSFIGAAFGITGIETSFQLLYTHLVKPGIATLAQLLTWMNATPIDAFRLEAPKQVAVGERADLALFDLETPYQINVQDFLSKGVNTPFIGEVVYGQTRLTLVAGQIAYQAEGEL